MVHFKYDIGELIYSVPIIVEHKDPLHIIKMSSDIYAVSYDDGCRFKLTKIECCSRNNLQDMMEQRWA